MSSSQAEKSSLPCPSWIWSNTSNIHVAKDRSWFSHDYVPIDSFATTREGGKIKVIGIGTVRLPVKISPTQTGSSSHGILPLKRVLHAPNIFCNLIGNPIDDCYRISCSSDSHAAGYITDTSGKPAAYFQPFSPLVPLFEVRLSGLPIGPQVGPTPFKPSGLYMLHVIWPSEERKRVEALLAIRNRQFVTSGPLTAFEQAWLRTLYESELNLVCSQGEKIFKDEFRDEGRFILRALAACDGPRQQQAPGTEKLTITEMEGIKAQYGNELPGFSSVGTNIFKPDFKEEGRCLLRAIMSYESKGPRESYLRALSSVTAEEKKWLKTHYGGEFKFLSDYGLKIFNEEDREEGRAIMRSLMHDEEIDADTGEVTELRETLESSWTTFTTQPLELRKYQYHTSNTFLEEPFDRRFMCFDCQRVDFFDASGPKIWSTSGSGQMTLPAGFKVTTLGGKASVS